MIFLFSLFSVIYHQTLAVMPTAYLVPVISLLGLGFLLSLFDPGMRRACCPHRQGSMLVAVNT
jgi:hypothetical protein